jgi:hypothetical protein
MSKRYHYNINLPVIFNPTNVEYDTIKGFGEILLDLPKICAENIELIKFLENLNIFIESGRYFRSPPSQIYGKHIDLIQRSENDNLGSIFNGVKLNFVYNSTGTIMKWYNLKPGYQSFTYINDVGEPTIGFSDTSVTEVYKADVNTHCILDGGTIHNLENTSYNNKNRICYSLVLTKESEQLTWESAVESFKPYLY